MVAPFMPDADKLVAVREALPAVAAGIYLNTGSVGPMPAEVDAAMAEIAGYELRTGRAHPDYWQESLQRMAEARAAIAAVLAAGVDDVALNHSTTDGMNVASWAADWRAGDRAVTTRHEHPGALGPLIALQERSGVELAFVDIGDGEDDERTLAAFDAAIVPGTRLVSLSQVLWTTGARLPVAEIAAIARAGGALVAVDGAQAVGAIPVVADELGADFYAVPGQKWLLGPEGMGGLWCSPAVLDRARSTFAGYLSFAEAPTDGRATWHDSARRFEVGNFHRPSVVGLARACGWLSMYVGLDWVHARGTTLARWTADRLAAIPGVTLVTPREHMATLVTFRIAGWPAADALAEIAGRTFAIARTVPAVDAVRFSVGFFNTEPELERVARAVELLAAHTPESLPPRPTLSIIGQDE